MDIAQVAASTGQNAASTTAFSQLTDNFDTFLTLLTTQLQNQDPLEPLDTEQFTQQLVQFAGVEQSIQTNQHLEALLSLQSSTNRDAGINLIGKTITAATPQAALDDGAVNWRYSLPANAQSLEFSVLDETGKTVAKLTGPQSEGQHDLVWSGETLNGGKAAPGIYTLQATGLDASGVALSPTISTVATVEAVNLFNNTTNLDIGGQVIAIDLVRRVEAPNS